MSLRTPAHPAATLTSLRFRGVRDHCPICERGWRTFLPVKGRQGARRPGCSSLERHRLLWLYLSRTALRPPPGRLLPIAPEECLRRRLSAVPGLEYVAGDLEPGEGDVKLDITALPFENGQFDAVVCSHVLEHVSDDRRALRELRRVLRPSGWAIPLVPIMRERTDEDLAKSDPSARLQRFSQEDHVRVYGRDFYDRLADAGFAVTVVRPAEALTETERERFGLTYEVAPGSHPRVGDWRLEMPVCRPA